MRQIVRDSFFDFTAKREGFTPFMYADTLNLVTTGVGNLIDNGPNHNPPGSTSAQRARLNNVVTLDAMAPALKLPWKLKGPGWTSKNPTTAGDASKDQVVQAWTAVKKQNEVVPDFSQRGGFAYSGLTNLTLDMDGLKALFNNTLSSFDRTLQSRYPGYEQWPADAQLAILSMSWAMGPAFNFPAFKTAVDREDFQKVVDSKLSFFKGGGGTLEKPAGRNAENLEMFQIAADVVKRGGDRNQLHFVTGTKPSAPASPPLAANIGTLGRAAISNIDTSKVKSAAIATTAAAATGGAMFGLYKLFQSWGWVK